MSLNTERSFQKYLKYKTKYLQLKSLQLGGDKGEILTKFIAELESPATEVTLTGTFDLNESLVAKIPVALAANKTLQTLTISNLPTGSAYQRIIGKELAKGFPDSLTTLNLIKTHFVNSDKPAFHDSAITPILDKLLKIKNLNLSNSSLTDYPVNTVIGDYIKSNKSIITLKLIDCNLGCNSEDKDINAIATSLKKHPTLESLDLSKNCIGKGADNIGSAIKDNTKLTELKLDSCGMGADGVSSILEALTQNKTLKTISLSNNDIKTKNNKKIAIALSKLLEKNTTLQNLDLSSNGIDDSGVIALASGLAKNKTLVTLNLDANVIEIDGAKALIEALKTNNTLEKLYLKNYDLNDKEASLLAEQGDKKVLIFR